MAMAMLAIIAAALALPVAPASADYSPPSLGWELQADGSVRITGSGCPAEAQVDYEVTTGLPPQGASPDGKFTPSGNGAGRSARIKAMSTAADGDLVTSGSVVADEQGVFTFVLRLPPGEYTVTCMCDDLVQVLGIIIPGGATTTTTGGGGGPLPYTGTDSASLIRMAAVLVGVGSLAAYASRKRRARQA